MRRQPAVVMDRVFNTDVRETTPSVGRGTRVVDRLKWLDVGAGPGIKPIQILAANKS